MADLLKRLRGTLSSIFRFGLDGPQLKSVSSRDVEFRDANDLAYGGAKAATFTFRPELDNGNSGTAKTIDWAAAQKQVLTLTDNVTLTFVNPPGVCNLLLRVVQDGVGSRSVTWPANLRWPGGTSPLVHLGQAAQPGAVSIVSLYFNGTIYYGVGTLDFK